MRTQSRNSTCTTAWSKDRSCSTRAQPPASSPQRPRKPKWPVSGTVYTAPRQYGACTRLTGEGTALSTPPLWGRWETNSLIFWLRRIDDDRGKSYELGQSSVKCIRGILRCWLRVADKIEAFKKNQTAQNALPTRFHLHTGQTLDKDTDPCMDNYLQVGPPHFSVLFIIGTGI